MTDQTRIQSIDAVRGFAVLGILLMNIVGMGLPSGAYIDPTYAGGATGANFWMWAVNFVVSDGKMRALFSMLFGASMYLIAEGAEGKSPGPAALHYRRMAWLLVIGLAHALLLWWGDILVYYAIAGALAFLLRKLPARAQLAVGAMLLALSMASTLLPAVVAAKASLEMPSDALSEIRAMHGGFLDTVGARITNLAYLYPQLIIPEGLEAVGQMLVGMALFRMGFFSLGWSSRAYGAVIAAGYLIGLPITIWLAWRIAASRFHWSVLGVMDGWSAALHPFIALAHASILLLLIRSGRLTGLTNRLAAAGRMALSNYLATSAITMIVFCGFGFGLFARLERAQLMFVVAGVWAFILIWSKPWLAQFHYGPAEWLWRSLVLWRPQPFVRR